MNERKPVKLQPLYRVDTEDEIILSSRASNKNQRKIIIQDEPEEEVVHVVHRSKQPMRNSKEKNIVYVERSPSPQPQIIYTTKPQSNAPQIIYAQRPNQPQPQYIIQQAPSASSQQIVYANPRKLAQSQPQIIYVNDPSMISSQPVQYVMQSQSAEPQYSIIQQPNVGQQYALIQSGDNGQYVLQNGEQPQYIIQSQPVIQNGQPITLDGTNLIYVNDPSQANNNIVYK